MPANLPDTSFDKLKAFFEREVAQRAMAPLRDSVEIALFLDMNGPVTLGRQGGKTILVSKPPEEPDMTFWVTSKGLDELLNNSTQEVGEIGVAILKLMASSDPENKLKARVHIGPFGLLRNGYLSVLPLGGGPVMKFLGTKGLTSLGKIKSAISSLKD